MRAVFGLVESLHTSLVCSKRFGHWPISISIIFLRQTGCILKTGSPHFLIIERKIHSSDQTCAAVSELYQCGAENSPLFRMILPHESLDFETVGKVILTSNRVSHQAVQKLSLELRKMKIILQYSCEAIRFSLPQGCIHSRVGPRGVPGLVGHKLSCWGLAGLFTNSIIFCWLFSIKDRCKIVRFQQMHNKGLCQLLLTVSWDLRA